MSSDVLDTALLVAYPLGRIAAAELFHQSLRRPVHLLGKVDDLDALQDRVVDVHRFLATKRRSDGRERREKKQPS